MVDAHVKPLLGKKLVIDLVRADRQVHPRRAVGQNGQGKDTLGEAARQVRVSGGAGSATRTAAALGSILSYAVGEGIIDMNPTSA